MLKYSFFILIVFVVVAGTIGSFTVWVHSKERSSDNIEEIRLSGFLYPGIYKVGDNYLVTIPVRHRIRNPVGIGNPFITLDLYTSVVLTPEELRDLNGDLRALKERDFQEED